MNKNIYKIYMGSKKYNKSRRYIKKSKLSKIKRRKYKTSIKYKTRRKKGGSNGDVSDKQVNTGKSGTTGQTVNTTAGPTAVTSNGPSGVISNGPSGVISNGPSGVISNGPTITTDTSPTLPESREPMVQGVTARQESNNLLIGKAGEEKPKLVTDSKFIAKDKQRSQIIKEQIKGIKEQIKKLNNDKYLNYNKISSSYKGLIKYDTYISLESSNTKLGSGGFGGVYKVLFKNGKGFNKNYALKLFTPNKNKINSVRSTALLTGKKKITCVEYINNLVEILKYNGSEMEVELFQDILRNEKSRLRILNREIKALLKLNMYPRSVSERKELQTERKIVILEGLLFGKPNLKPECKILKGYFMEICNGSLEKCKFNDKGELIKNDGGVKKELGFSFRSVLEQILKGLNWIHDNRLAHLDLFPRNILYTNYSKTNGINSLKICDFGFTEKFDNKVRDLFPSGEFITIPNNHHIDFYKENSIIKQNYDYYTLGVSIFIVLINGHKIPPTITNSDKLTNYHDTYTQLTELPTNDEIVIDEKNFLIRYKELNDTIDEKFFRTNFTNYILDREKNSGTEINYNDIKLIIQDLISSKRVEYDDIRFKSI